MTKKQAEAVGKLFDLPEEAVLLLQQVPYKGSLPTAVRRTKQLSWMTRTTPPRWTNPLRPKYPPPLVERPALP